MQPHDRGISILFPSAFPGLVRAGLTTVAILLSACGGDGNGGSSGNSGAGSSSSSSSSSSSGAASGTDQAYADPVQYAYGPNDGLGLQDVAEKAAVANHQLRYNVSGQSISYSTTAGHLTASDSSGRAEATMFYVAYLAAGGNGSSRPLTFFYNGGPGSSSIWLKLGSFAPNRVATPDPAVNGWPNFPLVDNQESLIDVTDMVFIDPPGTGFSEAISPNTNRTFWGVDQDAKVMRDFIERYLAVNQRAASPIYLYGESYGTPRTDVLAPLLEAAGVHLSGMVLQSCILDYNAQSFSPADAQRSSDYLAGLLPSYAAVAGFFNQVSPAPASVPDYMQQMRQFVASQYAELAPYGPTFTGQANPPANPPVYPSAAQYMQLSGQTGLSQNALTAYLGGGDLFTSLISGSTIGDYDARVVVPDSSPMLDHDSDPSDALVAQPFSNAFNQQYLPNYLKYTAPKTSYVALSLTANNDWDFSHAGQRVPDTIPDLLAEIDLNPQIRVLVENGYHDLVTPFFITEKDLGRLKSVSGIHPDIQVTHYSGGHMIYLDDNARPLMRADLLNYYKGTAIAGAMTLADMPDPWTDAAPAVVAGRSERLQAATVAK